MTTMNMKTSDHAAPPVVLDATKPKMATEDTDKSSVNGKDNQSVTAGAELDMEVLEAEVSADTPLYSGSWTTEEEKYVQALMEEFRAGNIEGLEDGASMRNYIAKMLHCLPKRVTKKHERTGKTMTVLMNWTSKPLLSLDIMHSPPLVRPLHSLYSHRLQRQNDLPHECGADDPRRIQESP